MIDGKPSVLFMEGAANGCNWYRIRQPYLKLSERDLLPCASNRDLNEADQSTWVEMADVVVSQAATAEKFLEYMLEQKGKKRFVIDMDDNLFAVSPFNPSYDVHGTKEVDLEVGDQVIRVRDGQNGFNLKANRQRILTAVKSLQTCDLVTTPSSVLSGFLKQFNKNVRVVKNFIDPNIWRKVPLVKDDFVRIGWQGGWSHYPDFYLVKNVLREIMQKHKNVILVIMGTHFEGLTKDLPQDRIQVESWTSVDVYPWKFRTLNIDIGLAPIENNEFNTCKSEIKWEEYSALEIPTVASNIPPYNLAIEHGKTGFLAATEAEWIDYLDQLIQHKEMRDLVGLKARTAVMNHCNLDDKIDDYVRAYKSLFVPELVTI